MPLPRHFWKSSVPVMLHPLCVDIRGFFFHGSLRHLLQPIHTAADKAAAFVARNTHVPLDFTTPTKPMPSKSVQFLHLCWLLVALPDFKNPRTVGEKFRPAKSSQTKSFHPYTLSCFHIVIHIFTKYLLTLLVLGFFTRADEVLSAVISIPSTLGDEWHCDDGTPVQSSHDGARNKPIDLHLAMSRFWNEQPSKQLNQIEGKNKVFNKAWWPGGWL